MVLSFNTFTVLIFGSLIFVLYVVLIYSQGRHEKIKTSDVGDIFFAAISIVGGLHLIYSTIIDLDGYTIETDKIYIIYGGSKVIMISFSSLKKFFKVRINKKSSHMNEV